MRSGVLLVALLVLLSGCGGGGGTATGAEEAPTTTEPADVHETDVDGVTCGELEDVSRRLDVAGELADEFVGTLTARNLLVPAFSAALSGACDGADADATPVPELVVQADAAERTVRAQGGSFLDALLDETTGSTGEQSTETEAQGTPVEQANIACGRYSSLISRILNDAVSEFTPFGSGDASGLGRRVEQLQGELAPAVAQGSADAALIEIFSAGLTDLVAIGEQIAEADAAASDTADQAASLKQDLRDRAAELMQPLPEATLFSCRSVVAIYS